MLRNITTYVLLASGALVPLIAVAACNSAEEQPAAKKQCPPAPLLAHFPDACTFPKDSCTYDYPHLAGVRKDICNGWRLVCVDGGPQVASTAIGCPADGVYPTCPSGTTAGTPCTMTPDPGSGNKNGNGECYVLGPAVDLDAGTGEVEVCACDMPGPIWRCTPWKLEAYGQDSGG